MSGSGAPASGLGVNGNFYIDTTAHNLYGPKTAGAWGSATSIVGPTGPTGPTGSTGSTGATGPAGPLIARSTVSFSTASIAAAASESDDVAVFKAAQVYVLATNRPARVRAYSTSAHRTADAGRAIGTDPTGNHGLLMEVVTTSGVLSFDLAPPVNLVNLDGTPATTIYFAVTNKDTSTGVVTTTLTVRQAE